MSILVLCFVFPRFSLVLFSPSQLAVCFDQHESVLSTFFFKKALYIKAKVWLTGHYFIFLNYFLSATFYIWSMSKLTRSYALHMWHCIGLPVFSLYPPATVLHTV